MNNVLIFAGGSGVRMKTNGIPKQFLEIFGKPIIAHTIEKFQKCKMIDEIVVVCVMEWIDYMKSIVKENKYSKVIDVIPGGKTGFDSRYEGLSFLLSKSSEINDIVLIHDGVRPEISEEIIEKSIAVAIDCGCAITISPASETIMLYDESEKDYITLPRDRCLYARAPQTFRLKDIYECYKKALQENRKDMVDSATIYKHYGGRLTIIEGPIENIKVTTQSDYYLLRGLWEAEEYKKFFVGE